MEPADAALTTTDLLSLVEMTGAVAARIDLHELLSDILVKAGQLTDSPDGSILLYNPARHALYFAGAIGANAAMLMERFGQNAELQVPVEGSKAGMVFSTGISLRDESVERDADHFKGVDRETHSSTRAMVCVPLTAAGERLGAMQMLNKRAGAYTDRDQLLLEHFAAHAALAIRNARLFENLLAHMGLYAAPERAGSAEQLLRELQRPATREKLTVMFADMRGFKLLCQIVNSPDTSLHMLSEFLTLLSEQVLQHGGVVNKFLGDGLLALFRADDHAVRAVRCAFAMVDAFNHLRATWDEQSSAELTFLDVGIGITTDEVILGTIGSGKLRDFTAVGTAVNLASAFEAVARNGKRILVDQITYTAVKHLVAEIDGPLTFELREPDQRAGHVYKQYHLKRLTPAIKPLVFISHSHKDRAFVEQALIAELARFNIDTWYSRDDIKGGSSWVRSISEGLDNSDWVVVVVSKDSATSQWVAEEVDIAGANPRLKGKVIPILLDNTDLEAVHPYLRHLHALDAREAPPVAERLSRLIRAVR